MTFNDIIGQKEMAERLKGLVDEDRLPHAIMLCGPDGCGKMAMAIALATYILDKGAYRVRGIQHPDLHFTFPTINVKKIEACDEFAEEWAGLLMGSAEGEQDVNPYFSLAQWMEAMGAGNQQPEIKVTEATALIKRMAMKSNQGGYKICIVWLPEKMNQECANKILKLIEEPPQQTLFIMVCREPERLLSTIRSRVQRYDMKALPQEVICKALEEHRGLDHENAMTVSHLANGNWLKAMEELNVGSENKLFFDYFVALMRMAYMKNLKELKRWSESVSALGREQQKRLLIYFMRMVREAFMYNFRIPELTYMTAEEEHFCQKFARFIHEGNVIGFQELYQTAIRDIGQNANSKLVFFDITMKVAVLLHTT